MLIPLRVMRDYLAKIFLTGKHRRQLDTVVRTVLFIADDHDTVTIWCELTEIFHQSHACHTIADND